MLRLSPSPKVYLAAGATDLRNNIDGLLILIEKQLKLNPFDSCLFVFCEVLYYLHHLPRKLKTLQNNNTEQTIDNSRLHQ